MNTLSVRYRNHAFVALIISLLLHICITLYVTLEKTGFNRALHQQEHHMSIDKQKKSLDSEWVETKAISSSFGAPVIFIEDPDEEILPYIPQTETEHVLKNNNLNEPAANGQNNQTAAEQQETPPETIEENLDVPSSSTITAVKHKQHTVQSPQKISPSSSTKKNSDHAFSPLPITKPLALNKKPLTLAQFTQGVLNYAQQEGNHAVSMIGKKEGTPTDEQIKYERYLQKLNWCLQNSFAINNHRFSPSDLIPRTAHVLLSLKQDGTLAHLYITKSSGDHRIDNFVLFIFRDASSSFPPVPHYLPHNPFTISYVIEINSAHYNVGIYRR